MNTLRQDSLAGIVVFLVALPLCLGIAQASGLPPFVGLLTGIIGGLVVTTLSPSRFAVSGPAAGLVTIVVAAIESLGSFSVFLMALVLAGVLQLLFGILRAGRFISLVPASVIKGMLAAIGILLIMQQIPVALGTAEETGLAEVVQGNAAFSVTAIAIAAGGLLVLWLWGSPLIRRVKSLRWIPGPLIAVLLGCVTTLLLTHFAPQQLAALPRITLPAFGSLGDLLGELESPAWSAWRNPSVWVVAVTLALVASLETLLSQEALKKLRPQNPPPSPNREMVAQGVGNLLSGVLGAMPITAVIVRSSVNVSNGAQSKLSIFIHGVLLLICGLWFSGLLTLIPLASLAAVLLYTGYKLATPRLFIEQFRQGAAQYVPFLATIGGIIAFGMLAGIGIGLATQMAFSLWRSHRHSLQLAVALSENHRVNRWLRTAFFFPMIIPMVSAAALWLFIFMPGLGLLDHYLAKLFGPMNNNWLGRSNSALLALALIGVWKFAGYYMLFFLAGLQSIPASTREAALMEGATRTQVFFKVTLPLLRPTLSFVITTALIYSITQIDHVAVMTRGGPDNATTVLLYYIQNLAWDTHDLGKASAATFLTLAGLFAFSLINLKLLEKGAHYER